MNVVHCKLADGARCSECPAKGTLRHNYCIKLFTEPLKRYLEVQLGTAEVCEMCQREMGFCKRGWRVPKAK